MVDKNKLQEWLELRRKQKAQQAEKEAQESIRQQHQMKHIPLAPKPQVTSGEFLGKELPKGNGTIVLNEQQRQGVQYALDGISFCLIGAAGTGKTTTVKEIVRTVIARIVENEGERALKPNTIALVSFTNRAVKQIEKAVQGIADQYCRTIHKFIEFQPVEDTYFNEEKGEYVTRKIFEPARTHNNPHYDTKVVIVDESSMVGTRLFSQLVDACPNAIFIFIGDLNQLKPIYDKPILGFALNHLPVVELTQVYRQAMESPIIWFQHNYTLKGRTPSDTELKKINEETSPKGLTFHPFKSEPDSEIQAKGIAGHMCQLMSKQVYDPDQDTILIPFNKSLGTLAINLEIAEYISKTNNLEVYEIYTGKKSIYLAEGDRLLFDKTEVIVEKIEENSLYTGKPPHPPSTWMSRYGYIREGAPNRESVADMLGAVSDFAKKTDFTAILNNLSGDNAENQKEENQRAASHKVYCTTLDGNSVVISTQGDFSKTVFSYALTIHKSQGSEWRKVWLILSKKHRNMLSREMLYTGMTRAREELTVLYSPQTSIGRKDNSIARCVKKSGIPGLTWKEKAKFFEVKEPEIANTVDPDFSFKALFHRLAKGRV